MACAFLLGLGDSSCNTQIFSFLSDKYKNDSASAFALFKFMQVSWASSWGPTIGLVVLFLSLLCSLCALRPPSSTATIWSCSGSCSFSLSQAFSAPSVSSSSTPFRTFRLATNELSRRTRESWSQREELWNREAFLGAEDLKSLRSSFCFIRSISWRWVVA